MSRKLYMMIIIQVMLIENVFAYLDPGTMTYFMQALVAIFVGGFFAIKTSWLTIRSFFSKLFRKNSSS